MNLDASDREMNVPGVFRDRTTWISFSSREELLFLTMSLVP